MRLPGIALLLVARVALACAGGVAGPSSLPRSGDVAPTNTCVLVFAQDGWALAAGRPAKLGDLRLTVNRIADGQGTLVAAARRDLHAGNVGVAVLTFPAALSPHAVYDVTLDDPRPGAPSVAWSLRFETGDGPDRAAPTWPGVDGAVAWRTKPWRYDNACNRCPDPQHPWVVAPVGTPRDDATPAGEVAFALWLETDGKLDDQGPPTTILRRPLGGDLVLGVDDVCGGATRVTDAIAAGRKRLRAVLRAVDLAGNASAPSTIDVPLDRPRER